MLTHATQLALQEQKLIASAWALAQAQAARCILIASADHGAGKTTFAACVARRARWLTSAPVHVVRVEDPMPPLQPDAQAASVWVDGVSVLAGELLALDIELRAQLNAAIVVAEANCTTRAALREVALQLKAAGIPALGCVWNRPRPAGRKR